MDVPPCVDVEQSCLLIHRVHSQRLILAQLKTFREYLCVCVLIQKAAYICTSHIVCLVLAHMCNELEKQWCGKCTVNGSKYLVYVHDKN